VEAFARPRVTLLSTGDEVAPAEAELTPGQIYDSNTVALAPLIERGGAELVRRERCPDDPAPLRAQLELGLGGDLLCVVGGMSKGTHDLVPQLLEELGVEWLVTSLNLKPGKPTRIGRRGGAWVIGLPGNPVSAAICFLLFGTRILAGLQGRAVGPPLRLRGEVQVDMPANGARPLFQPAQWSTDREGAPRVCPIAWRGSGDPFGLASADALLYRPAGAPPLTCGEHTPFIPLEIPE
jgi:molybdopterin molybdotransferase